MNKTSLVLNVGILQLFYVHLLDSWSFPVQLLAVRLIKSLMFYSSRFWPIFMSRSVQVHPIFSAHTEIPFTK